MMPLSLREFHAQRGARFESVGEMEAVTEYGQAMAEYSALHETAGVLDLSFRGRVCLTGADRARFLHGQVTNDVNRLRPGSGCYAALVTAKGKMQSDLNIYNLGEELLLDFEPGISSQVIQRLEKYIIADDVQLVDVSGLYGLLSVQGPKAATIVQGLKIAVELPDQVLGVSKITDPVFGEIYFINHSRLQAPGYDVFVPTGSLETIADRLVALAQAEGGGLCGQHAFEMARIESGLPRFGVDMDETIIPLEAGIEARAVSFAKGCYIGQEVLSRIRTYGHVTKVLRGLMLPSGLNSLPRKGDKLFHGGKEMGYMTSAVASPAFKANLGMGYVRKEVNQPGTVLTLRTNEGEQEVRVVSIPFQQAMA
jgi:folate-binding protein YgfZ